MHPILSFFGWSFAAYSFFLILGCVAGVWMGRDQAAYLKLAPREVWGIALSGVFGGLLGAKLGHLLIERPNFWRDSWGALATLTTGWVFWPGILLAVLLSWAYVRFGCRRSRAFLPIADCGAAGIALGQAVGRIGCLLEGCCYGRPTTLPWGLAFTHPATSVAPALRGMPLHPTQLYEIIGEAVAVAILVGEVLPGIRSGRYRYGTAFLGQILYYSVLRFGLEFLRADDRGSLLWPVLSPSQWISLCAGLAGALALWRRGVYERDPRGRSLFLAA